MSAGEKRKLLKEVLKIAERDLALVGMKRKSGVYAIELSKGVWGRVGLNVAMNRGEAAIGINPIVGVRYEAIETLIERLSGENALPLAPTLNTAIGYVMPEASYVEWHFQSSPFDYAAEMAKMVAAIERYGVPFMREHASINAIVPDLENKRFSFNESIMFRLPVAYLLIGRTELAMQYVRNQISELVSRTDEAAQVYRTFAMNFLRETTTSTEI